MSRSKDSGYLFSKMESPSTMENGGHVIVGERSKGSSASIPLTKTSMTYRFNESGKPTINEKQSIRKWMSDNVMLLVTLCGVTFGIITGLSLRPFELCNGTILLIAYPGELFLRILKLMILPLVIASLITGSASVNARMNGKIALRTFTFFALTSLFNAILGVCLVLLIHPGDPDMHRDDAATTTAKSLSLVDSILDLGRNIFPDNIFQAAFQSSYTSYVPKFPLNDINETDSQAFLSVNANPVAELKEEREMIRVLQYRQGTNTLGIVLFCLIFGTILGTIGEKGQVVISFFAAVFEVIMKMVLLTCLWIGPIGIASVIAGKILDVENLTLIISQLLMFIITVASGVFFYQFIVLQLIYFLILKKNPYKFYGELVQPMLTAFATASTAAALPLTFQVMEQKLRVDKRITRFVLPIGCNINMDGTALFIAVSAIFIAQMSGMELGVAEVVTVCLTSFAASMSSASVPSAALVLLIMVLTAIDAPLQDVTLLFAIDWFVDRIRTTNNMLGDVYCAVVVEHLSMRELMACDATALYKDSTASPSTMPELIVVNSNAKQDK